MNQPDLGSVLHVGPSVSGPWHLVNDLMAAANSALQTDHEGTLFYVLGSSGSVYEVSDQEATHGEDAVAKYMVSDVDPSGEYTGGVNYMDSLDPSYFS